MAIAETKLTIANDPRIEPHHRRGRERGRCEIFSICCPDVSDETAASIAQFCQTI